MQIFVISPTATFKNHTYTFWIKIIRIVLQLKWEFLARDKAKILKLTYKHGSFLISLSELSIRWNLSHRRKFGDSWGFVNRHKHFFDSRGSICGFDKLYLSQNTITGIFLCAWKSFCTIGGKIGFNLLILYLNEIESFIFIGQNEETYEDMFIF